MQKSSERLSGELIGITLSSGAAQPKHLNFDKLKMTWILDWIEAKIVPIKLLSERLYRSSA